MKNSALKYAIQACEAIMAKYTPEELPPRGCFFYHQGVFLSGMERVYELTGDRKYFDYIKICTVKRFNWRLQSVTSHI